MEAVPCGIRSECEGKTMSHYQPDPAKSVNLTIDGIPVTVPEGTRILEAAKKVNVNIPTLCEHPDLCKRALCRLCVVECDGRGKLAAACANDVWEGVNVVTNNKRIQNIRKTIIELIMANHPQDCNSCIRSKKCELQALSKRFNILEPLIQNDCPDRLPLVESETIVRNLDKCVKCGRCVEECQEVQTIRAINTSYRSKDYEVSTPYGQTLKDSSCVFCGQCAAVCPVGAIYEHDQSVEVLESLANAASTSGSKSIAQISKAFVSALEREYAFAAGTFSTGKIIAALKLLGFYKVYDEEIAAIAVYSEIGGEIQAWQKGGKQPVITGCSEGVGNFVRNFYPDLAVHLTAEETPRRIFASFIKNDLAKSAGLDLSNITSVSFVPCIAQKYTTERDKTDFALTAPELARMFKFAGIMIETMPEEPFDTVNANLPNQDNPKGSPKEITVKKERVCGFAQGRKVMETIREGKCDAQWVEILSCPGGKCDYALLQ
jgi:iron only hydrogenase large subunit-like protein